LDMKLINNSKSESGDVLTWMSLMVLCTRAIFVVWYTSGGFPSQVEAQVILAFKLAPQCYYKALRHWLGPGQIRPRLTKWKRSHCQCVHVLQSCLYRGCYWGSSQPWKEGSRLLPGLKGRSQACQWKEKKKERKTSW
jgi:hypothetical protein